MKTILSVVLLAGFAFAQATTTPAPTDKPKSDDKKMDCCGSGGGCCGSKDKDKAADSKKGGCCGGSSEGAMCGRKEHKDATTPAEPKK
jgi:hypothetical protein